MGLAQTSTTTERIARVAGYALMGAAFGFVKLRQSGEGVRPRQYAKTVVVYAIGGLLAGLSGDPVNQATVAAAAAGVAPIVDALLNEWLPPAGGGSPKIGTGATD